MSIWIVWLLFVAFIVKHYFADFTFQQYPYMYENKHLLWHPGGWLHAGIHGGLTLVVLTWLVIFGSLGFWLALFLGISETIIHHEIDRWKMLKTAKNHWGPATHAEYWLCLGQDQMAHYLTYAAIIVILMLI